jgi:hypothetical protein
MHYRYSFRIPNWELLSGRGCIELLRFLRLGIHHVQVSLHRLQEVLVVCCTASHQLVWEYYSWTQHVLIRKKSSNLPSWICLLPLICHGICGQVKYSWRMFERFWCCNWTLISRLLSKSWQHLTIVPFVWKTEGVTNTTCRWVYVVNF